MIHSRILEHLLDDCGFAGTSTGLISVEALQSKIKKARKEIVSNLDNTSLEHPVPYRVLATHCLSRKKPLDEETFIALWLNNLFTTIVTARQNRMLIKFQSDFKIGDCWRKMYERAGVMLVDDPDFRNNQTRIKFGLEPSKKGRKKNAK